MSVATAKTTQDAPVPPTGRALLLRLLRRHRGRLLGSVALLSVWQLCEALVPVLIGVVIDRAVTDGDGRAMLGWGLAVIVLFVVLGNGFRFGSRLGVLVSQHEAHDLRLEIAGHALRPTGARTTSVTGEVLSLATADAEEVGDLARSIGFAVAAVGSTAFTVVVLLRVDLVVGLVVIVGLVLTLLLIQAITPAIARRSRDQQSQIAGASGFATDAIAGLRVLKGIGAEDVATGRYRRRSQDARAASIRTATSQATMGGVTVGLSGIFLAVVALTAGQRAMQGQITVGELVAVVGLAQFLAEPLRQLGHVGAETATAYASAVRIVDYLHTPHLIETGPLHASLPPRLTFDKVRTPSLHGASFEVPTGALVGLVVDEPVVAADIVQLTSGERTPQEGTIRLGGHDVAELSIASRRATLLQVPHHTHLFAGSIRDNVDLGVGLDKDRLDAVIAATAVADIAALHPGGLDHELTSGATTLSGGQQQRIALARALAADPPLLVLHDPTSAVDAVTEQHIADGLVSLRHDSGQSHPHSGHRTTLVITNSPALLARADLVVVLRAGEVVASGSPDEVRSHVHYQELVLR